MAWPPYHSHPVPSQDGALFPHLLFYILPSAATIRNSSDNWCPAAVYLESGASGTSMGGSWSEEVIKTWQCSAVVTDSKSIHDESEKVLWLWEDGSEDLCLQGWMRDFKEGERLEKRGGVGIDASFYHHFWYPTEGTFCQDPYLFKPKVKSEVTERGS